MLIEKDSRGELLLIDDALRNLARARGEGFGGAVAEMSAQAELYTLTKRLGS